MTYTRNEILAYAQSFARRIAAGEEAAVEEVWLWLSALEKVQKDEAVTPP